MVAIGLTTYVSLDVPGVILEGDIARYGKEDVIADGSVSVDNLRLDIEFPSCMVNVNGCDMLNPEPIPVAPDGNPAEVIPLYHLSEPVITIDSPILLL